MELISFTPPSPLHRGKIARDPSNERLGGPHDQCRRVGGEKNLLVMPQIESHFLVAAQSLRRGRLLAKASALFYCIIQCLESDINFHGGMRGFKDCFFCVQVGLYRCLKYLVVIIRVFTFSYLNTTAEPQASTCKANHIP